MNDAKIQPFFSVIIPTYNREGMIGRCIESVLNQSFQDFELIIVDDGSTDNTMSILEAFQDDRISVLHQGNKGRSIARNVGVEHAGGKFICFQDSDDIWNPKHLRNLHDAASRHSVPIFLFTHLIWRYPDKDVLRKMCDPTLYETPAMYCVNEEVSTITVCISSSILNEFRFDPALVVNEDLHLWARISSKYPIQLVDSEEAIAFQHEGNTQFVLKDAITPSMNATRKMFVDPICRDQFTKAFKRSRLMGLRHQYIKWLGGAGKRLEQSIRIIEFIILYPKNPQNKSKLVTLIYNLPVIGNLLSSRK